MRDRQWEDTTRLDAVTVRKESLGEPMEYPLSASAREVVPDCDPHRDPGISWERTFSAGRLAAGAPETLRTFLVQPFWLQLESVGQYVTYSRTFHSVPMEARTQPAPRETHTMDATDPMSRAATADAPRVVVVVLNWNGRVDTLACLASLTAVDYPNWEVIVVDNGSEDGSVDAVRKAHPAVAVIESAENLGFAGGNNLGIDVALQRAADFILLLNNDTTVAPDLLSVFVRVAHDRPDAGALSGKIYFMNDPQRLWYAGTRWNRSGAAFEHVGQGVVDGGDCFEQVCETDYACGCAMFLRASAVRAIGPLDERFFLLFEETDWCFRAKRAGFRSLFVPGARLWHRVSASLGGRGVPLYEYFYARNRLLWAEMHLPRARRAAVWLNTLGTISSLAKVVDIIHQLVTGRCGPRQAYWEIIASSRTWRHDLRDPGARLVKRARLQGVRDYLAGRFGNCPSWIRAAGLRGGATAREQ
jgi:GT2 family glycosyltransferase